MGKLTDIIRRHSVNTQAQEKQDKQTKCAEPTPFPCLSCFSSVAVWNQTEASRLIEEADALVALLELDGNDPAIQSAAAMVVSAHLTGDMETLNFACVEFTEAIRSLAQKKSKISKKRDIPYASAFSEGQP